MLHNLLNFKPSRSRDHGFYYYSAPEGNSIKVEVFYDKGGMNFFSGGTTPRGIMVSMMPVERRADGCETCILGQGIRACVEPLERFNLKRFAQVVVRLDSIVPGMAAKFTLDTKADCIRELVTLYKAAA